MRILANFGANRVPMSFESQDPAMRLRVHCLKWYLIAFLLVIALLAILQSTNICRAAYQRASYDSLQSAVPARLPHSAVLVFSKTNEFRDDNVIEADDAMSREPAAKKIWRVFSAPLDAVFTPDLRSRFQVVVFNSASGAPHHSKKSDEQRPLIEPGGGHFAVHPAGGNSQEGWLRYFEEVIGSRPILHAIWPHASRATIHVEADEWYSFYPSVPGFEGYRVLATLDEFTFERGGPLSGNFAMGRDYPIIWVNSASRLANPSSAS